MDNQNQQQQQRPQPQPQQQNSLSRPIAPNPSIAPVATNAASFAGQSTVPMIYSNNSTPLNPHQHGQQHVATGNSAVTNAMNSQVMGQLMTNPALAAVAAATPLLPPAAMITNPGAFLTVPEYYRTQPSVVTAPPGTNGHDAQQQISAKTSAAAINSSVAIPPQLVTSRGQTTTMGNQQQSLQTAAAPQPQQQQQQQTMFTIPGVSGMQYQTILPYGVNLSNSVLTTAPGVNPLAPSSVQVHMAANAAASQAIAVANARSTQSAMESNGRAPKPSGKKRTKDMTSEERAQQNRDRNREHARSTRLRKKAYVSKLKELVDGLHAERTEEVRQRRVAIQHLAETQDVRRAVVRSFLRFHASYEKDKRKWSTLLEDSFWFKQPITPYRCFRKSEIENESRITRGVEGVISDASSIAVMIEGIGSRSSRWAQLKREKFIAKEDERTGRKRMPRNIVQRNNRFRHAISSISASSSDSSNTGMNNSSGGEENNNNQSSRLDGQKKACNPVEEANENTSKKISSSSHEGQSRGQSIDNNAPGDFHDYHAKPLPDPKLPADQGSGSDSGDDTKRVSTSSVDDSTAAIKIPSSNGANKRRKIDSNPINRVIGGIGDGQSRSESAGRAAAKASHSFLPGNMIAKKGGIAHNVRPVMTSVSIQSKANARLATAPAVALPPFAGIGKRSSGISPSAGSIAFAASSAVSMSVADNVKGNLKNGSIVDATPSRRPNLANVALEHRAAFSTGSQIISGDVETSSINSSRKNSRIRAYYHFNEDDMILMNDVIMCPFVFRTQDAVRCGALAECVMPGMLRGEFSSRNKLLSLEMVYDSMGLMQQLERCSGSELVAQIIPGSLEMALAPVPYECRAITLAKPPYLIINVNEAWTKLTKHTQLDVEGKEFFRILDSDPNRNENDQAPNLPYDLEEVTEGRAKYTTRFHFDKDGREFVDFMCSYPLTNSRDEVTHILHVSKELRSLEDSVESPESDVGSSDANYDNS